MLRNGNKTELISLILKGYNVKTGHTTVYIYELEVFQNIFAGLLNQLE